MPWWKSWKIWGRIFQGIGIGAAVAYAIITYVQWRDLRHDFEAEQRSWLATECKLPIDLSKVTPDDFGDVVIMNTGKVPVLRAITEAVVQVVESHSAPSLRPPGPDRDRLTTSAIFPGGGQTMNVRVLYSMHNRIASLGDSQIKDLRSGKCYLAIFGQVVYSDEFGLHWHRFCTYGAYQSEPNANSIFSAGACTDWNTVGDGKPPQ